MGFKHMAQGQCGPARREEPLAARILRTLPEIGRVGFGAYIAIVIVLLAFVNGQVAYYQQYGLAPYDLALLAAAVVLGVIALAIMLGARKRLSRLLSSPRAFLLMTLIGTALLVAVQLVVIFGARFETGWDVGVLTDFEHHADQSTYFSTYPNQWFLAGFFSLVGGLCSQAGVDSYLVFTVIGALGVAASVGLSAYIGRALAGPVAGMCAFTVAWVLLGLNPNILVPYSDAYGMLCPTLVLFLYVVVHNRAAQWLLMPFFMYIGYCIKPTAVFALAAPVAVEGLLALARLVPRDEDAPLKGRHAAAVQPDAWRGGFASRTLPLVGCAVLSLALALGAAGLVERQTRFTVDESKAVGIPHYLMMGFNEEYNGVYSPEDFAFTSSFATVEERAAANLSAWWERVEQLGPVGIGELFAKKAMLAYGEGAFTWRDWYFEDVFGENEIVRWVYGIPDEEVTPAKLAPDDVVPWAWPAQVIWFMVLVGIVPASIARRADRRLTAICLALLMMSAFLLIFECRARYLFLFGPWFVVAGTIGWRKIGLGVLRRIR